MWIENAFFVWDLYGRSDGRYMETKSGHLAFVRMVLEFLAALQAKILCTLIVKALFLERQVAQDLESMKS